VSADLTNEPLYEAIFSPNNGLNFWKDALFLY